MARRALAGGALAACCAAVATALNSSTVSFSYTGSCVTYTVPDGVSLLGVTLAGAAGGSHIAAGTGAYRFFGGRGALITGNLSVTPREILQLVIGRSGTFNPSPFYLGAGGDCDGATRSSASV